MSDSSTHAFAAGTQVPRAARHVFGPVASRRLGRSLGIDLLPHKTCTLDCIYCECGRTTDLRTERSEFFPTAEVVAELDEVLPGLGDLDSVTFSGSGEPLLHLGIGEVVSHLKRVHPGRRVTVLTNGTQLRDPAVRTQILQADVVVPSLDSATEAGFRAICRPHPSIRVEDVVEGIAAFRREFSGELYLEVFVVPGVNDTAQELSALRAAVDRIRPNLVQLNRLDRPGTVSDIRRAEDSELERIAAFLLPHKTTWTPARKPPTDPVRDESDGIAAFLRGHGASSVAAIAAGTGVREGDVSKLLRRLVERGVVSETVGSESNSDLYSVP